MSKKPKVTPGFGRKPVEKPIIKLDLGCGPNPKEGFTGVDIRAFSDKVTVADLRKRWPWKDSSVSEVHCSHFIEHLDGPERMHFVNELYRVLVPGGSAQIIAPYWASSRAYGDLTHKWPPVSDFWFYYLSKDWRKANAPHDEGEGLYNPEVDFEATWGYALHPSIVPRNQEYQQNALLFYKEAAQDVIATLKKKG